MEIQKEKDLYLAELLEREVIKKYDFDDIVFKPEINAFHSSYLSARFIDNINFGWSAWQAAKARAVPEWISTSDRMPEEGEAVLLLDKNNTIHDGYLSTDYVDGPYGENGEDFGGDQTLWSSNSNGEELLLNKVKYWMHRPSNPSASKSGAKS